MTPAHLERLGVMIAGAGQDWMLDVWGDAGAAAQALGRVLDATFAEYAGRYPVGTGEPVFDLDALAERQQHNPEQVNAFFQSLGVMSNPAMLAMVWRIIQGDVIKRVSLDYAYEDSFRLGISLEATLTGRHEQFESVDIYDAIVLRHVSIIKDGEKPIFEGFASLSA